MLQLIDGRGYLWESKLAESINEQSSIESTNQDSEMVAKGFRNSHLSGSLNVVTRNAATTGDHNNTMLTDQALEKLHILLNERSSFFFRECKSTEFDHSLQQWRPG
jgi:hypothetical protein